MLAGCQQQAAEAFEQLCAEPEWDDVYFQNRPILATLGVEARRGKDKTDEAGGKNSDGR